MMCRIPRRGIGLVFGLLAALAGCETRPRTVKLSSSLRTSCGANPGNYDISCLRNIEVRLLDKNGDFLDKRCTTVSTGRYPKLSDLVSAENPLPLVEETPAREAVVLELRGYRASDDETCTNPDEGALIFWGKSGVTDLAIAEVIDVSVECRPDCDCNAQASHPDYCSVPLHPGVCVPTTTSTCRKACDDDVDCWDPNAMTCADHVCTPKGNGGLCNDCSSPVQCEGMPCVRYNNATFCAPRCPPVQGSEACLKSMGCRRIGGNVDLVCDRQEDCTPYGQVCTPQTTGPKLCKASST